MPQSAEPLPEDVIEGATLAGNEYGWTIASFPEALRKAESHGLACLGGQFQFRIPDGTCEMYWLGAESAKQHIGEPWSNYSRRSIAEVRAGFDRLIENTDFRAQALEWPLLKAKIDAGFDPLPTLVFVSYFVTESELHKLLETESGLHKLLE